MTNPTTKDETDMQIPSMSSRLLLSITTDSAEEFDPPRLKATSPGATTCSKTFKDLEI